MEPTAIPMTIVGAASALTDLGVLPVVTLAAVIGVAAMLYRRFRK